VTHAVATCVLFDAIVTVQLVFIFKRSYGGKTKGGGGGRGRSERLELLFLSSFVEVE
jgi:hypothetical protein